jgi:plastocyanin
MYNWWVFVHIVGVVGFMAAHGVSIAVTFRLRKERDPQKVGTLLELSGSSMKAFYASLVVLLAGGIGAATVGHWWSYAWIWAAIIVLVVTSIAMTFMAKPYYRRAGLIARAMAGGSQAVAPAQFDEVLSGPRPWTIAWIGLGGLAIILYLMVLKPTLGFTASAGSAPPPAGNTVQVFAKNLAFNTDQLTAPGGVPFTIVFENDDAGVQHNVAIYTDSSLTTALFQGTLLLGPKTVDYQVQGLQPGTYYFRCDIHPPMNGTFVVQPPSS